MVSLHNVTYLYQPLSVGVQLILVRNCANCFLYTFESWEETQQTKFLAQVWEDAQPGSGVVLRIKPGAINHYL